MLFVCVYVQMPLLTSIDKLKDMQTVDISQYVSTHGLLPGKSAADSVAGQSSLRQEHPVVVAATTDAHTNQAEARTCNIFASWSFWVLLTCIMVLSCC